MATDDKAAPPELFPHLRELAAGLSSKDPPGMRGREPPGVPSDCAKPAGVPSDTPQPAAQTPTLTLEELVALLKRQGVAFNPTTPFEPARARLRGELALLRHAKDALEADNQDLKTKVRELESALHAANVAARTLRGTNVTVMTSTIELETQFEAERTLAAELSRQVDVLRLDAGNAARARVAERKGFELQIEQLQKHLRERRTELEAARAAKATLERVRADAEGNAAEAERVQKQHAGQIQRQRDLINSIQDANAELSRKLEAVSKARDTLEREKLELAGELDSEIANRPPTSVSDALAYLAKPSAWAVAVQGKQRYLTNAFDRVVEAHMWFVKATTKEEA